MTIFTSCRPTRRLAEGDVFLRKNTINIEKNEHKFELSTDDLYPILKQTPNRKILFAFRFNLGMHNMINPRRKEKKHIKKVDRVDKRLKKHQRNEIEATKNRKKAKYKRKYTRLNEKELLTWRDKWTNIIGEPPVVIDTALIDKSVKQLNIYLIKKGYFDNTVSYEIKHSPFDFNNNKAKVNFNIIPNQVYTVSCVNYSINDESLKKRSAIVQQKTKVRAGQRFDVDNLNTDREQITNYFNNRGYYFFTKDFINYEVDSALNNHQVDLYLNLDPFSTTGPKDSLRVINHQKFFIGNINIYTNYNPLDKNYIPSDTLFYPGFNVYYDNTLTIKPALINRLLEVKQGQVYQKDKVEISYKRFASLGVFDGVNIQFIPASTKNRNILDCEIRFTPAKRQAFSFETTGTHRDGSLGLQVNTSYKHKNLFGSAEAGQVGINFGIEAQRTLLESQDNVDDVTNTFSFNTFEIGPEISINLHNLFPFPNQWIKKSNEPSTKITGAYNFQKRPDYERTITQVKFTGNFIENKEKGSSIYYDLFNISLIQIDKSDKFTEILNQLNNPILTSSYNNHFISSMKLAWVQNSQKRKSQVKYHYLKPSIEFSGFVFRGFHNLTNKEADEDGSYEIFNIKYSNYIKLDNDYRWYRHPNSSNTVAFRIYTGWGIPLWNLHALPFEKSFYAGGSNGIRGWQARSLGPGSYRDTTSIVSYSNLGEIRLEYNLEYRFKMTDTFEGAIFIDAGNIWLQEEDLLRPGGNLRLDRFWHDVAVGSGLGLRMDFDYFLVRFDLGVQLKDPKKIEGEQWAWDKQPEYDEYLDQYFPDYNTSFFRVPLNLNLGIGYPF